ncbi:Cof-type HAD-IIB family hydrolase [Lentibacillus sp. Marseille-P4043]|uniref:Cof-type HAD-IIB family hydrolase n=1 Tax=Lentibacillus sp. Marseille-P4043 TaxID=2040293 RepID=UPI000D0B7BE6|nr:Cof-type HAD-IIB family hydrolase [Lentibacillus sp. Marseille-P4043]
MTQKIIFFDIDNTLLDYEKKLPESTKKAVQQLQDDGHIVAIASGRAPFAFKNLLETLNISTYVSLNGQYVVYKNQAIYENQLDFAALNQLNEAAAESEHPIVYLDHEDWRSSVEYHPHVEEAVSSLKLNHPVTYDPNYYRNHAIYQSLLFCDGEAELQYKEKFPQFEFIRWHRYSVDVLPNGGSKANGIKNLIHHLGIDLNNTYAFGDGLNDIEMLKFIPNSVAMGNAELPVKEVAKHITKDVNQNGVFHGLKIVGLL